MDCLSLRMFFHFSEKTPYDDVIINRCKNDRLMFRGKREVDMSKSPSKIPEVFIIIGCVNKKIS